MSGEGEPLLLIAGIASDVSSWPGVSEELSRHFKVINFDNAGAGRSGIPEKSHTIRDMADDAVSLLDYLKIKKANILGHSMGGYIAQEIAINYPKRVEKLILESTSFVSSKRNNELIGDFNKKLKENSDPRQWFGSWTEWLFSQKTLTDKNFIETFIQNGMNYPFGPTQAGLNAQTEAIKSFDSSGRLGNIRAKTMVVEGSEDKLILPEEAKALARKIPGCVYKTIEGAGHCIHIESPELFLKAVFGFFQG